MRTMLAAFLLCSLFASPAEANKASRRACAERKENIPAWQKIHYAFAMTADGEHCGWAFGFEDIELAIPAALGVCRQNAKRKQAPTCKVVYSR